MICEVLVVTMLLAPPLAAAPPDVSGTWHVTMEGDKRPIEGTLLLEQKGTELTGQWTSIDAWTMKERVDAAGRFELESETRPVPMTNGSKKGTVEARWVFRGAMKDGALSGTAAIEVETAEPRIRKWSASKGKL